MKQKRFNKSVAETIHRLKLKKVNVEIIELGQLPFQINFEKLKNTKSELFDIKSIRYEPIFEKHESEFKSTTDSDYGLENDKIINKIISENFNDYSKENTIYFFISYIHMANEWYCRQVDDKSCIAFSFADIYDKLAAHNIPPENLIKSTLTAYSFYYYFNGKLPSNEEEKSIMHRDTRGCIMDFCANNIDAIFSAERPYLCSECIGKLANKLKEKLKGESLSDDKANALSEYYGKKINKELRKIKKNWLVRVKEFVQKHFLLSLSFSLIFPFTISALAILNCTRPFSWKIHGLALISSSILLVWFVFLGILISWENKKFHKFRKRNL